MLMLKPIALYCYDIVLPVIRRYNEKKAGNSADFTERLLMKPANSQHSVLVISRYRD
jgi:hypothetical protein